jgi:hypothetical protein
MLQVKRLVSQITYKIFRSKKTKGPKQDGQNQLRLTMSEGGKPKGLNKMAKIS